MNLSFYSLLIVLLACSSGLATKLADVWLKWVTQENDSFETIAEKIYEISGLGEMLQKVNTGKFRYGVPAVDDLLTPGIYLDIPPIEDCTQRSQ